jgi:uncharacterized membrane protein YiaA
MGALPPAGAGATHTQGDAMSQPTVQGPTFAFVGASWLALLAGAATYLVELCGLWNAHLAASEKGFYAMCFVLSLFAAVAVQKNLRDLAIVRQVQPTPAE